MAHLLEIDNLSAAREGITVVRDFSLTVAPGEVVGLLGANGAGKSTIVDAVSGFAKKVAGTVRLSAEDISRLPPHKIAALGVLQVSQDRELFGMLSVEENLVLGMQALSKKRRGDPGVLDTIYELFPRLRERRTQRAGSMSGGEQQMLAIGRALAGNPVLLILDEPTAGLAPAIVKEVGQFLAALRERGLSILLVEQNVGVALDLCDRIAVVRNGRKVFHDTKDALGPDPFAALGALYV